MSLLKQISVTGYDFTLNVSSQVDDDLTTVSLIEYELDKAKSTSSHEFYKERNSIEIRVDPIELREVTDALNNILTLVDRDGG